jgi:multidrug efflux pump subunit AcrB
MRMAKIEFSFIAFFSLLLSLGLLVDDTIVVISAMTSYFRTKGKNFTPFQTGLLVWRDFWVAVFTTTLTTVWAFVPLLLSTGIIGEFIKPIPIVVSSTLIASFFVGMFLTLPIMVIILKPQIPYRVQFLVRILTLIVVAIIFYTLVPKSNLILLQILAFLILMFVIVNLRPLLVSKVNRIFNSNFRSKLDKGLISFEPITDRYRRVISRVLDSTASRRKAVLAVVIFFIFAMLILTLGLVKNEFFPPSDEDYLYVSLELPPGTNLNTTEKETLNVLNDLRNTPELVFANANLGTALDPSSGGFSSGGSNGALISLILTKHTQRYISSIDIAQQIRDKYASYSKGKISIVEVSGGPPAGADLQIKLFGPDLNQLDQYAGKIQDYLKTQQGITNIDKSIKSGTSKITFVPDLTKLSQNNLTLDQVGFWLRAYASGFKAESVKFAGEKDDEDITIRLGSTSQTVQDVSKIMIPTQTGNIPIVSLGTLKLEPNPTLITREDGNRTISVTAGVKKGFNVADKNKELEKFADSTKLPSGYSWKTGGVNEENQKSVNSILQAMLLSFLLIVVTMVIQFSSFRDALIVMLVIPLAVSGVFIIFALTHTPLSFPALIGILALFGIVVKNSILLVDKINRNKTSGMRLHDAIADATSSRIEPIFLTSFATIMGLIPITLSNPLWRGLGGSIIAGLTFSGTIMLIFIPVVYYLMFSRDKKSG